MSTSIHTDIDTNRTDHDLSELTARHQLPLGLRRALVLPARLDQTGGEADRTRALYYERLAQLQRWYPRLMLLPVQGLPGEPEARLPARDRVLGMTTHLVRGLAEADLVIRTDAEFGGPTEPDDLLDLALELAQCANFDPGATMLTTASLEPGSAAHTRSLLIGLGITVANTYATGENFVHDYTVAVPAPPVTENPDSPVLLDWLDELLDFTGQGPQYADTEALYEVEITSAPTHPHLVGRQVASQG